MSYRTTQKKLATLHWCLGISAMVHLFAKVELFDTQCRDDKGHPSQSLAPGKLQFLQKLLAYFHTFGLVHVVLTENKK